MTTADLLQRLRTRYGVQGREWVTLAEVANGTGAAASRSCDLLAISLWGSGGREWHGHEIKVSRSDWLREIRDPDKADAFARYCDRWWIVAGDSGIVQPGELREGWGLMLPRGNGLVIKIGAAKREATPPGRPLLAAIFRRCMEASPGEAERNALLGRVYDAERKAADAEGKLSGLQGSHDRLRADLQKFEDASGIRITGYDGPRLAENLQAMWRIQKDAAVLDKAQRITTQARQFLADAEASQAALAEILNPEGAST